MQTTTNVKTKEEKPMKQEHADRIKSIYDVNGEFKKNERYSGEQGTVYTKAGDNAHWLVMEQKGSNGMEVRMTDEHGRITARDRYESTGDTIKCTSVERPNARKNTSLKEKLANAKAQLNTKSANRENRQGQPNKNEMVL
jgi:hypothetical protein